MHMRTGWPANYLEATSGNLPLRSRSLVMCSVFRPGTKGLICLLPGNPSVVLIDEFSTGIDAKMKRDMWVTLRNVAVGKAVVITTRTCFEPIPQFSLGDSRLMGV